ncbi:winged helix-turn-helix transcriptional regulator [bacterium]|nr:winged helix-turn-helix transcriptional regulator [bacterium]
MSESILNDQIASVDESIRQITFGMKVRHSDDVRNLSQNEMLILNMVSHKPDLILKEIREYLQVPQTTLSSIIAKLEKAGYVKRIINRRDLRSFSIEITNDGRQMIDAHMCQDKKIAEDFLSALDNIEERCSFVSLMEKIAKKIGLKC